MDSGRSEAGRLVRLSLGLALSALAAGCDAAPEVIEWEACGEHQCATIRVPEDHADPTGPSAEVRVLLAEATRPTARRSVIVFFPGGPGGPGIDQAEGILPAFDQLGLRAAHDVLFMDPRGTGRSDRIDCVGSPDLDRLIEQDLVAAVSSGDLTGFDEELLGWQERCRAEYGARLDHLGSDQVADDLERVRVLLGVDALDGFSVSYGTRLAAQYASRHGEHVHAFVLDSTVTPSAPSLRAWFEAEARDYRDALERFFDACGASAACSFHGGAGAPAVAAAYDTLLARLGREEVRSGSRRVRELHLETGVNRGLAGGDAEQLGAMLASAEADDWEPMLRAADDAFGRMSPATDTLIENYFAILANDVSCPAGFDLGEALSFSREILRDAPRTGLVQVAQMLGACLHPIGSRAHPLTLEASVAPPLLVMGGAHDPATPRREAEEMVAALGNGSYLVEYTGDGHFYTPRSLCIAGAELAYLARPTVAPTTSICP